MYIQITTRCNMSCDHCCFSCTSRGRDMKFDAFLAAVKHASLYDDTITIGGGEPTLRPHFLSFLAVAALYRSGEFPVTVITNGSNTELSLQLADFARRGIISCSVSRDPYHAPIDPRVFDAFTKPWNHSINDYRSIRNTSRNLIGHGRARLNQLVEQKKECLCSDIFVTPLGNVYSCGCKRKKLGHVLGQLESLEYSCIYEDKSA